MIDQSIKDKFPAIDFSTLDPIFPKKEGPYAYTESAITTRAADFLSWARARPEKVIVVVSHAGFLRIGLVHRHFMNADYRVFSFKDDDAIAAEGVEEGLVEWEETSTAIEREYVDRVTKENKTGPLSGGMKKSWPGYAPTNPEDFS